MYFVAKPNPAEYGKLVKLSFSALRSVDHGAKLILGGLFSRPAEANLKRRPPLAYFAADFLDKLYRMTPGIQQKFQGYGSTPTRRPSSGSNRTSKRSATSSRNTTTRARGCG